MEAVNRSDAEIGATRSGERDAFAALPPDVSRPEAQFPAFMKDVIVRMRTVGSSAEHGGTVRCRQEVWRLEVSTRAARQVKRSIAVIDIESKTGNQIRVGTEVRYYRVGAGDTLESVYDENAAQL
jgi:hypothetical protein